MSDAAVNVSHLYFKRRLTKQEIAKRLGISRFKVARLLDEALEEGLVRIEITEVVPLDEALGRALEQAYALDLALVVSAVEDLDPVDGIARVAARWLPELIREEDVLGVAWGSTVQRVASALGAVPQVPVVQICGHVAGAGPGSGPLEVGWQFAERLGGEYYPLPVPALLASPAARDEMLENGAVAPTVAMFDRVTVALVGIGSLDREGRSSLLSSGLLPPSEVPPRAVGDLLVHLFDEAGALLASPLGERAVQLPAEQLRRARAIAVAGGPGKSRAVASGLRTGLVDVLVTDEATAAAIL
jgi:DNA-binding transcriptional regulator LsrR (DeoR family)